MKLDLQQELGQWYPLLKDDFATDGMRRLGEQLSTVEAGILCPSLDKVFRAFRLVPPNKVKVVILGQDPYISGEADGLAFSSGNGSCPYSLKIIFEELAKIGQRRTKVTLDDWAAQGVLLINHSLTTIRKTSNAHAKWGWQQLTDKVLWHLVHQTPDEAWPKVFMAWGKYAQDAMKRQGVMNRTGVRYLESHHPAATRYGYTFTGASLFQEANRYLIEHNQTPIQWGD